jgi:hypothetical protein
MPAVAAHNCSTSRTGTVSSSAKTLSSNSPATVSATLNHPEVVHEATRAKIAAAVGELGYVRGGWLGELAAHWRRTNFATWLFQPVATGRYPKKGHLLVTYDPPDSAAGLVWVRVGGATRTISQPTAVAATMLPLM